MTPESLAALAEKVGAMTFGKAGWTAEFYDEETQWVVRRHDRVIVAEQIFNQADAEGIAALRNNAHELLRLARRGSELESQVREWAERTKHKTPDKTGWGYAKAQREVLDILRGES